MIQVSPLYPNNDVLTVIGEFCFLSFHSRLHNSWSMAMIAKSFEPPIYLKQFQVYRAKGVPRGLVTWARLDVATEEKFIRGNGLDSYDEWQSGDNLWIVDLMAPWGHGKAIINDVLQSMPGLSFKTLRDRGGKKQVVQYYRSTSTSKWKNQII
ncbi:MAG: toxin-activating lysine-acyltransferase [Litoreibacter sp.]